MNRRYRPFLLASVFGAAFLVASLSAFAEAPQLVGFSGVIFEDGQCCGYSYQGPMQFKLFDAAEAGNEQWSERHGSVSVDEGYYSVSLGVSNPIGAALLVGDLFLEVAIEGEAPFSPRIPLTSVPYALVCSEAANAETFQNMEPGDFSMSGHSHGWADITGKPTEFAPASHTHGSSDISDWPAVLSDSQISWSEVQSKPSVYPAEAHDHDWTEISSKPSWLSDDQVSWSEVTEKPTTFDAAPHDHAWSEITSVPADLSDGEISWSEVTSKPTTFTPAAHDHNSLYYTETEMDGFLSGKANVGASYTKAQSDAAYLAVGGKAADADKLDGNDSAFFATQGGLDTTNTNLDSLSDDLSTSYYDKTETDATFALITALNNAVTRIDALETNNTTMQGQIDAQQTRIQELEDPDCPLGYSLSDDVADEDYTVCKNGDDELVKVGDFWIDRYEIVLVDGAEYDGGSCDGSGTIYGQGSSSPDWDAVGFVRNGSDITTQLHACSVDNVEPTRNITWFQAQAACGAAGKVMCTDAQWQLAAFGTPDPDSTDPGSDAEKCNIWSNSKPSDSIWGTTNQTILGGSANQCISRFGAYDMVGNVWEWTSNWWGQGADSDDGNQPNDGEFHGDGYWNVDNAQANGSYTEGNPVFPASALRGGTWSHGSRAGVFALHLNYGPARWLTSLGSRCCRRK